MMKIRKTYEDYKISSKDIKENLHKDFPGGEDKYCKDSWENR